MLAAAIVALAAVIGLVARSTQSETDNVAALPAAAPTAKSPAAPAAPSPAVRPSTPVTPVTTGQPSGLVASAKSALFGAEESVLVTVHVSPRSAVVFKDGLRFGTGTVTLEVARGKKTTLFARLDGYLPRTFVVDGENTSVNIALSRRQSARVTVARPVRARAASSPEAEQAEATPARVDESPQGVANTPDTAAADTPSGTAGASNPEPSTRSQSPSTGTAGSEPTGDIDPF